MALADLGFTMTPMLSGNAARPMPMPSFGPRGPIGPDFSDMMQRYSDQVESTALPMPMDIGGVGSPMSAGISPLPMDPMLPPQGPGIPSQEALAHPTWLDNWAASDRVPTFGMTGLDHEAKKAAIKAGLLGFGSNLLSTMGPGNQNFMGNIGSAVGAGAGAYRGTLNDAETARRADESFALDKEKQEYAIQSNKDALQREADTTAANKAERDRVLGTLTKEQQSLLDPFIGSPDKDFYGRLEEITSPEQQEKVLRVIGDRAYRIGDTGPAEMVGGILPKDETGGGEDGVKMSKILSEARMLAKQQYDAELAAQERARGWAEDSSTFPETVPANRLEQLIEEKVEFLQGLTGGEISRGGGAERPTAVPERETAGEVAPIPALIDSMGLPPEAAAEFKSIAANLEAQGKSPEEIRAMLQEALQSGG